MQARVVKWGNSLGVRIPQAYAESVGLRNGTPVEILTRDDEIVIRRKEHTLAELLAEITPENMHGEVDWGGSVGREVW